MAKLYASPLCSLLHETILGTANPVLTLLHRQSFQQGYFISLVVQTVEPAHWSLAVTQWYNGMCEICLPLNMCNVL